MEDVERVIGRLEEGFRALEIANRARQETDKNGFAEIRGTLSVIDSRISTLEPLIDRVDLHGDGLTNLEQRMANLEKLRATQEGEDKAIALMAAKNAKRLTWLIACISATSALLTFFVEKHWL